MVFKIEPERPEDAEESNPDGLYTGSFEDESAFHEYLDDYYKYYPKRDLQVIPGVTTHSQESLVETLEANGSGWRKTDDYDAAVRLITDGRTQQGRTLP